MLNMNNEIIRGQLLGLPVGVEKRVYKCLAGLPVKENVKHCLGFRVEVSDDYPVTLADGTVIMGVMIGPTGDRCYLVK